MNLGSWALYGGLLFYFQSLMTSAYRLQCTGTHSCYFSKIIGWENEKCPWVEYFPGILIKPRFTSRRPQSSTFQLCHYCSICLSVELAHQCTSNILLFPLILKHSCLIALISLDSRPQRSNCLSELAEVYMVHFRLFYIFLDGDIYMLYRINICPTASWTTAHVHNFYIIIIILCINMTQQDLCF